MHNDNSFPSLLKSNLEIEYYRWYYRKHGTEGFHYRFDPLTGKVCQSDDVYCRNNDTYYICWSEYPVYNYKGVYIGLYYDGKFIKPTNRSNMSYAYSMRDIGPMVWSRYFNE